MKIFSTANILYSLALAIIALTASAFAPQHHLHPHSHPQHSPSIPSKSSLHARQPPVGPFARAKKLLDPTEYNRVIDEKMKQSNISKAEAEADYNSFLENPPIYYALEKKEEYYMALGYKDVFEGMIGEAEKEGRGDAMREEIAKFKLQSKIKAYSVLVIVIVGFIYVQGIYNLDPENFMKGGLPDYSRR